MDDSTLYSIRVLISLSVDTKETQFPIVVKPKKLLCIFLVKMLYAFGIAPNLKSCVSCGKNEVSFIDLDAGGALCKDCASLKNSDELYIWKEYYYGKKDTKDFTACNYDAMLTKIRDYYQRYASIYLKLQEIIKK